jgi:hypothetical protein
MEKEEPDTISDAGLEPGEYLVIHVGGSFSNKQISDDRIRTKDSEYWFFQVTDRVNLNYSPYTLKGDSGNEVGPIDPETGVNYQRLYSGDGKDILRVEDSGWRVYHFGLGVQQDDIRIYPRVPDNQNGGGFDWLSGSEPSPQEGSPYGYFPARQTGYDDPAIELESISWETSSRSPIQYGFYNENPDEPVDPIVSIRGWGYELRPVEQEDEMLNILADTFRFKSNRENAVRQVEFSKQALRSYSFDVPEPWKNAENNLTVSKTNLPGAISAQLAQGADGNVAEQANDVLRGGDK